MTLKTEFTVSATAIKNFELCPRKEYFRRNRKRLELPDKKSPAMILGLEVHAQLENWNRDGTVPDNTRAGKIAQRALPLGPPPKTALAEEQVRLDVQGRKFYGIVDVAQYDRKIPEVLDYKTTGARKQYLPRVVDLKRDAQPVIYGMAALVHNPEAEYVDFAWLYLGTSESFAVPVKWRVPRRKIVERMTILVDTHDTMRETLTSSEDPLEIPYDSMGCTAYGGCPYAKLCKKKGKEMSAKDIKAAILARKGKTKEEVDHDANVDEVATEPPSKKGPSKRAKPPKKDVNKDMTVVVDVEVTPLDSLLTRLKEDLEGLLVAAEPEQVAVAPRALVDVDDDDIDVVKALAGKVDKTLGKLAAILEDDNSEAIEEFRALFAGVAGGI